MCNLVAATSVIAGGTLLSAYGDYQTGQYNEAIYENNAAIASQAAGDAIDRGEEAVVQRRRQGEELRGQQTAAIAASGFDISGSESASKTLEQTAVDTEADALQIRNNAQREAWMFRAQATNLSGQGELASYQGRTGAFNTLLQGGSQVASFWYNYNR